MVHVEQRGPVAVLRFDRPPANAIELESARAIERAVADLETDAAVRALVLTGTGAFFSAGVDLKVVPTYGAADQRAMVMAINGLVGRLYASPRPIVAAVNGHAIAGGLVVALACDYRIACRGDVRLGLTEAKVGVPYPVAALAVVQAELSPPAARRLVLVARNGTPEEALADGAVDELVPRETVLDRAVAVAEELAGLPADTYARTKRQLRSMTIAHIDEVLATGADPMLERWITAETGPAAAAVLDKRGEQASRAERGEEGSRAKRGIRPN
jgi:enoyl-CoA hydratase